MVNYFNMQKNKGRFCSFVSSALEIIFSYFSLLIIKVAWDSFQHVCEI